MEEPRRNTAGQAAHKYLAFRIGAEEYGLPVLSVHEIIGMQPITLVPRAPRAVRGVINLRGKIVPVVDLRVKFAIPGAGSELCIVVVRTRGRDVGIVVDAVSEVLAVPPEQIAPTTAMGGHVDAEFVTGIGTTGGRVRFLLDIDAVLAATAVGDDSPDPAEVQRP